MGGLVSDGPPRPRLLCDPDDVTFTRQRGDARLSGAAVAVGAVFLLSGAVFGTWVSRLPAIRDQLGASTAELGIALLMPGFGSLLSMPFMGRACARWGSRRMVGAFGPVAILMLPALAYVQTVAQLALALLLFGVGFGAWDVAMNVQGAAVDRQAGRAWMSRYHAGWSLGGISGAGLGALAAHADLVVQRHFQLAAVAAIVLLLTALPWFVPENELPEREEVKSRRSHRLLDRRLVAIGAVTACATSIEGAAADWLAIYLVDDHAAVDASAAAGYVVFAVAMAVGRLAGTSVLEGLGRMRTLRVVGALAGVGIFVTVVAPTLWIAYVGAALWGLGIAVVFPAAMSAGGEAAPRASDGIAAVSTIGYAGFLLGPPLIGVLGDAVGLGRALLVLLVLAGGVVALAPSLRTTRPRARLLDVF